MTLYKKTLNEALNRMPASDIVTARKHSLTIILDDVRSMQNVGSIFRSADAFLIERLFLCGITPSPPHRDIHKTALGATDTVAWHYEKNIVEVLQTLQQQGYCIIAIEQTNKSVFLNKYVFDKHTKYAFVLGNEMNGVQEKIFPYINACIELPQYGTKHSINVAVCAGICMWECVKQIR